MRPASLFYFTTRLLLESIGIVLTGFSRNPVVLLDSFGNEAVLGSCSSRKTNTTMTDLSYSKGGGSLAQGSGSESAGCSDH